MPYVRPQLYAFLMHDTSIAIKRDNPDAKIVFGGLGGAWNESNAYLRQVYEVLDAQLAGSRPFDYLAIHPYFNDSYGLNPQVYMHVADEMRQGDDNILDKFVTTMLDFNDANKKIWITELGWNSAKGHPGVGCLAKVVVSDEEQATYLRTSFDILFDEVPAVEKIFWYQYMDVGIAGICPEGATALEEGVSWKRNMYDSSAFRPITASGVVPWEFGLYRGDKYSPKPAQCAFAAYPLGCTRTIFLPLILR